MVAVSLSVYYKVQAPLKIIKDFYADKNQIVAMDLTHFVPEKLMNVT